MHIEADNPAIAERIREYFVNMAAGKSLSRDFHLVQRWETRRRTTEKRAKARARARARGDKRDEIRRGMEDTFSSIRHGVAHVSAKWDVLAVDGGWSSTWKTRARPVGRKRFGEHERRGARGWGVEGDEEFQRRKRDVKRRRQGWRSTGPARRRRLIWTLIWSERSRIWHFRQLSETYITLAPPPFLPSLFLSTRETRLHLRIFTKKKQSENLEISRQSLILEQLFSE